MDSKELARIIGVSQSTISRALNDSPLVSDETKEKIKQIAEENGFVLNSQARSLRTQRTRTIGIIFQEHFVDFTLNMFQSHIFNLVRKELQKYDYDVLTLFDNPYREKKTERILEVIRNNKVDGVLIFRTNVDKIGTAVQAKKLPYVHIMAPIEDNSLENSLWVDFEAGGYKVGRYFGRAGHKEIAVVSSNKEPEISDDKTKGLIRALKEFGVTLPKENVIYGDFSFKSGYEAVKSNLDIFKKVTAVFSHNDAMALGIIEALREEGKTVPNDIEIIGHDNIPISEWFKPYLSTIHIDSEAIITNACIWLRKQISGDNDFTPETKIIKPNLLLRGTCSISRIKFDKSDEITI